MIPMAMHFRLHPWDIGRLTIWQFEIYAAAIDEMTRLQEQRAKEAGRPVRKR